MQSRAELSVPRRALPQGYIALFHHRAAAQSSYSTAMHITAELYALKEASPLYPKLWIPIGNELVTTTTG